MKKISILLIMLILLTSLNEKGILKGRATYYHDMFIGRKTANGEIFKQSGATAASNNFPLGTMLRVVNIRNDKSIVVRINDRMAKKSQARGVVVDLSRCAFAQLDNVNKFVINVRVEII